MSLALGLALLAFLVVAIIVLAVARHAGAIPNQKKIDGADGSTAWLGGAIDSGSGSASDCGSSSDGGGGCG